MKPELKNLLRSVTPEYRPLAKALYDNGFRPWRDGMSDTLLIVDVAQVNRADSLFQHVDRLKGCFIAWGFEPQGEIVYQLHAFDAPDCGIGVRIEVEGVTSEDFTDLPPFTEEKSLEFSDEQIRIATVAGMSAMSAYLAVNGLPAQKSHECNSKNVAHWSEIARKALENDPPVAPYMEQPKDRLEEVFRVTVLDVLDVDRIER